MTQKGKDFVRIWKHYTLEALKLGGHRIDNDTYAELEDAERDLLEALNPKVTVQNAKGPFIVKECRYANEHRIAHITTGQVVGFFGFEHDAHQACKWLNERYDK